jgi:pimeloyl-ACP methyl ester carboxylesterase
MATTVRCLTLSSGVRLQYAEAGSRGGLPVLLLHGVTDSWRSFEPVLARLPGTLRAVAVTLRGHGDADRPDNGYAPADLAADVAALIGMLRLGPAVVVGHSMGASVALRLALDHPGQVLGLVLAGARASWRGQPEIVRMWADSLATLRDPVDPAFARAFQQGTLAQPIPPGFLDTVVAESLKLPARIWQAAFRQAVLGADDTARLGEVAVPTLLLCGDRDSLAADAQAPLQAGIPGARRVTYTGCGHALHWEQPGRFAADLADFAARLAGSRAAA